MDGLRGFADAPIILLHKGFELFRGDFRKLLQERLEKAHSNRKALKEVEMKRLAKL
jgi:hypothetical protein